VTRTYIPQPVLDAAHARAAARAARDWSTADRLRDEIEAAGWRVIDAGTDFRLEPQHPPDVEVGGTVLYGRSSAVPSLLDETPTGLATVVINAGDHVEDLARATRGVIEHAPAGVGIVIVADDPPAPMGQHLDGLEGSIEVVRTSERLGAGAAMNAGLRRARAEIVVLMDPSIELAGDAVSPLAAALEDPAVAVAGPFGLRTTDLRRFEETSEAGPVTAIEGYLMAFRRSDGAARGPVDEAFRFYRNLDIWWSLVLRDAGPGEAARQAVVVAGLPVLRHEHRGWTALEPAERERLSKRNFYRLLDRFRDRSDLAVPGETG
jgi:glycosyltransferase involved in cell wall biosynthesis